MPRRLETPVKLAEDSNSSLFPLSICPFYRLMLFFPSCVSVWVYVKLSASHFYPWEGMEESHTKTKSPL